jgi:hypothetical protein
MVYSRLQFLILVLFGVVTPQAAVAAATAPSRAVPTASSLSSAAPPSATLDQPPSPWQLAVHGGWWDLGATVHSPWGAYAGLGWPWLMHAFKSEGHSKVRAIDARMGYQWRPYASVALRLGAFGMVHQRTVSASPQNMSLTDTYLALAAGISYLVPSGFFVSLDVTPIYLINRRGALDPEDRGWKLEPPPQSLALSQASLGYLFDL